jgi:NADH-ubiquinone oxidoreductase chain 5
MYLQTLILPFILFTVAGILGRYLGSKGIYYYSILGSSVLFINTLILYYEVVLQNNPLTINLFTWLKFDYFNISWNLLFDDLSVTMLVVVSLISLIVLIYSYDYMINDPHLIRFFTYILLFVFCMFILVTTSSLPILFIGWEGVGLTSFLLVSFWYTRLETNLGAVLAIVMNRVGDVFFLLGIFLSVLLLGSSDVLILISSFNYMNSDLLLISFFIAAMAKSAQLYLHLWLPYSMEGPTPISSLIHSATMVTAGVFLLLRLSLLISYSYYGIILITLVGALTTFVGGTLAITSLDMKELIAYSTMSQLGYMTTIIGLKYANLSFFHLVFHAYFKALLFLTAGSIIHTVLDIQDLRLSGALIRFLPISYIVILVGITSLTGLPFTTGFYSKEAIINASYSTIYGLLGEMTYWMCLLTALMTIYYSYRFILTLFFKTTRLSLFTLSNLHYYSLNLTLSLILIAFVSIFLGFVTSKWVYFYNLPINFYSINFPLWIKLLPFSFFFIIGLIYIFFKTNSPIISNTLVNQYQFKKLYTLLAGLVYSLSYRIFYKIFDYGFLDLLSPLTGHLVYNISKNLSNYLQPSYYVSLILFFLFYLLMIF